MKKRKRLKFSDLLYGLIYIIELSLVISLAYIMINQPPEVYSERREVEKIYQIIDEEIIYGCENKEKYELLKNKMEVIPDEYIEALNKKDWKIIMVESISDEVVNYEPTVTYEGAVCMGITKPSQRLIFIVDTAEERLIMNMMHEIGHAIDFIYDFNESEAFLELYDKYKQEGYYGVNENPIMQYAITDKQEFFATIFKDVILYPTILKEKAPDAYAYMQEIIYHRNCV